MSVVSGNNKYVFDAVETINQMLLARRNDQGWWTGRLSTSALSTATATMALHKAAAATRDSSQRAHWVTMAGRGLNWLMEHQNSDGGWGDTVLSVSNISTTMLAHAVFCAVSGGVSPEEATQPARDKFVKSQYEAVVNSSGSYITEAGGVTAVLARYGKDRTFSVPILTHCALAGIVEWKHVIPLPFELACVPHQLYAAVRMPVVSYALPALIAIGQVIFRHQGHWNPLVRIIRRAAVAPSLRVLESIQPSHGGFLEATPLTSFVCMSLLGCGLFDHVVTQRCLQFIEASVREDGSWPIDTNLTTWVTTLSVNALAERRWPPSDSTNGGAAAISESVQQAATTPPPDNLRLQMDPAAIRRWLLGQQYRTVHPYTHAAPGGWSWTDLPGGVPDADDTPGALLALLNLREPGRPFSSAELSSLEASVVWLLDLQNRDGGWPTFCRGWGTLPFDRSSCDLTAHVLRALHFWVLRVSTADVRLQQRCRNAKQRGIRFLESVQRSDGTWLPLWFGHQFNADDENPLYGTSRVVRSLATIGEKSSPSCLRAVRWLLENQNSDGGWSARRGLESSVEETGLALDSLADFTELLSPLSVRMSIDRAAVWLSMRVNESTVDRPSPIGFYFARLWYFEDLYPIIFAAAGLNRWRSVAEKT